MSFDTGKCCYRWYFHWQYIINLGSWIKQVPLSMLVYWLSMLLYRLICHKNKKMHKLGCMHTVSYIMVDHSSENFRETHFVLYQADTDNFTHIFSLTIGISTNTYTIKLPVFSMRTEFTEEKKWIFFNPNKKFNWLFNQHLRIIFLSYYSFLYLSISVSINCFTNQLLTFWRLSITGMSEQIEL